MSVERYADWLARGRTHQAQQRMIDALLCYRRALRDQPQGTDAHFHIGEIAWHMGQPVDALAAWRSASALTPSHVPTWQALADALAAVGDLEASLGAVSRVLALRPRNARARVLRVLLAAAAGDGDDASLTAAVRSGGPWPLVLLARILERALAPERHASWPQALPVLLDAALAAIVTRADEDALRRIALALARWGDAERARAFADRYAQACHALHRPPMPLLWPRRTAGDTLRAGILAVPGSEGEAASFQAAIANADLDGIDFEVLVGADTTSVESPDAERALTVAGEAAARAVAKLDLDVLIDLADVRVAAGPMLASHPARAIWAVERGPRPCLRALADRVFEHGEERVSSEMIAALRELKSSIARAPRSPLTAAGLADLFEEAVLAHRQGNLSAARAGYARVLDAEPGHAPALYLAGALARTEHDDAAARERFRAAIDAAPRYVEARVALVNALGDAGDADSAAAIAREGLDFDSASTPLWRALGQVELKRGDAAAAIVAFDEALRRDPTDGETHYNHGVALQTAGRSAEAARAYQRALAFRADLHAADFNLGVIFDQQGNAAAAIAAFTNVLRQAPNHVAAYKALAETLLAAGRIDAWFANFERFEKQCPDQLALAVLALEVSAYRADFVRIERYLDGLRRGAFKSDHPEETLDALQQLLYLLHFFDVEAELIGRHARLHDELARTYYGEPAPRRTPRMPGRIRIGYLSGDFRNHVMGKMMWEALRRHDHARFDVVGYATTDARDEWTARFEATFSRFRALGGLSDRAAAELIAADDLDVLVDLSTHTKGSRPGILAAKPARVQITHVASAGTLAMAAIDFKLTDRYADTRQDPELQIEPLLAMEGCVYPYRHVDASASAAYGREALRIARDAVVIGAFCTPLKLSQRCLALWRDVMTRIPRALLAFSPLHPSLRAVFRRIVAAVGIDARRVVFLPQGRDDAENRARYRVIDFVLDPMPYGGVNGTLEALDMGVPVVTLVGRRHAERTSFSILSNLGVMDTIAQSGGDYVAIAQRLASDPPFMRAVRERIAAGLRQSPLTDMDTHARNLEAAYLRALEVCAPEALAAEPASASTPTARALS